MKVLIYFIALISSTLALPAMSYYLRGEYDEDFKRYIYVENKEGKVELVDLKAGNITRRAIQSDVTYYLFTKSNPDNPYVIYNGDLHDLELSPFDPKKKSLFIIHGWNNDNTSSVNKYIKEATLGSHDVNVFVVDWSGPANSLYLIAMGSVVDIGSFVGEFINGIQSRYGLGGSDFVLAGHSLGAHVVGNAGAVIKDKLDYIIGLDPASPLFTVGNIDNRIDPSDAKFVQIIHTNGLLLGFATAIGTSDYYPNGGMTQPGCGIDLTGSCSHGRSYQYLAESITRGPVFESKFCDSYDNYGNGRCVSNPESPMGQFIVDTSASGTYYLTTNSDSPYGLS